MYNTPSPPLQVRPYGVSKGAALASILDSGLARWRADARNGISDDRLARLAEEETSPPPGISPLDSDPGFGGVGGELPPPPVSGAGSSGTLSEDASERAGEPGGNTEGGGAGNTEGGGAYTGGEGGAGNTGGGGANAGGGRSGNTEGEGANTGGGWPGNTGGGGTTSLSDLTGGVEAAAPAGGIGVSLPPRPPMRRVVSAVSTPSATPPFSSKPGGSDFPLPFLPPAVLPPPSLAPSSIPGGGLDVFPPPSAGASTIGGASTTGEGGNARLAEKHARFAHFDFVLCMSEVMARDEDLFVTLQEHADAQAKLTAEYRGGGRASELISPSAKSAPGAFPRLSDASSVPPLHASSLSLDTALHHLPLLESNSRSASTRSATVAELLGGHSPRGLNSPTRPTASPASARGRGAANAGGGGGLGTGGGGLSAHTGGGGGLVSFSASGSGLRLDRLEVSHTLHLARCRFVFATAGDAHL
jgi:hypothetical protein